MLVLGRELKKLIGTNEKLFHRIKSILENALKTTSDFPGQMINDPVKETIAEKRHWLRCIYDGLTQTDL